MSESNPPIETRKSLVKWIIVPLLVLLLIMAGGVGTVWAIFVRHSDQTVVRRVADFVPVPAAKLGGKTIFYRDFLHARDTLRTFLASPAAKEQQLEMPLDQTLEKNVLEKLLMQAALEELAEQKNVQISQEELHQSFSQVIAAASSTTPDIGLYLMQNFGWNEEDFRQQVLRPALLEQKLSELLTQEAQGDPNALGLHLEKRLQEKDVVRYLRF